MTYLQLAAHLFLLVFWTRVWVKPAQSLTLNPFLSGPLRLGDTIAGFLRPALGLPDRMTALALLLFFWAFQAMFFIRFGTAWRISFGLIHFRPPGEDLAWGMQFAYSGLRSAHLLLQAWTLYFFTRLIAPRDRSARAHEAFAFFMSPFSRLPLVLQPFVLLALHAAFAFAVLSTGVLLSTGVAQGDAGRPVHALAMDGSALSLLLKVGLLAMMSFASGLETLIYAIIFFILGGLALTLFGAQFLSTVFRESTDVLMGRFARNPAVTGGGLDFTPMIFVFAVSFISGNMQVLLMKLLRLPLHL